MALYFLGKANIQSGQQVLVYGASGANGTCAVQLAKHLGAEVTAVCSTANVELLRSLGADTVLDYTKDQVSALRRYDVVFDAVGRRKTSPMKAASRNALTPAGKFISVDDSATALSPRRSHPAQGARRGGEAEAGDRQAIPAGADRRSPPVRRAGTQEGQRRHHHRRLIYGRAACSGHLVNRVRKSSSRADQ